MKGKSWRTRRGRFECKETPQEPASKQKPSPAVVRGLLGNIGRHDDLISAVHRRLTVVRLAELLAPGSWHYSGVRVGEVPLGLILRDFLSVAKRESSS